MNYKLIAMAGLAVMVSLASYPASAGPAVGPHKISAPVAESVSFRGTAFPHYYNWSRVRACTRYEHVETPRGIVLSRVWVCAHRPSRANLLR